MQKYLKYLAELIADKLGKSVPEIESQITLAPENIQWDLAFPCFKFAKERSENPVQFAQSLVAQLQGIDQSFFTDFVQVWPYVNAILDVNKFADDVLGEIRKKKADYGVGDATDREIIVEWRQPNTHKAVHIWHIRNILVSESVSRILKFAGNKVVKCCYPGDIWAHVAKWLWYYTNFYDDKWQFPRDNFTRRVWQLYTLATKTVDENPDIYKTQIETLQKQLEDWDPVLYKLREETRKLCLDDMKKIFAELGSWDIDKWYFESEVEKPGIEIVKNMLAEWKAQISQGAVAIDLEERNLGRFLLLKSTGASLYSTKDIALAFKKREDYPDYDISLYVVWSEQEHHFQQLFKTLEIIGFDYQQLRHLSYWLIDLKSGKMSSRDGNIILYEDFRDQLLEQAKALMEGRNIPDEEKLLIARKVAFSAMKFAILLQDSEKRMTFDETQALSFEGETWPYLQYTVARINSIMRKISDSLLFTLDSVRQDEIPLCENQAKSLRWEWLNEKDDIAILVHLAQFPEIVQKSAVSYKPNYVARYCLDLAQLFNSYYQKHKIIDETNIQLTNQRLGLIQAIKQVLVNGFDLLGIEEIENM